MKLIRQKHKSGCAIAALAMVANKEYDEIRNLIYPNGTRVRGLSSNRIYTTLEKLNLNVKIDILYLKHHKYNTLNNAILNIVTDNGTRHAVVWDSKAKKLLDPGGWGAAKIRKFIKNDLVFVFEIID